MSLEESRNLESNKNVGWMVSLVFFALLSGPPKFRIREADASLYKELDLVLIVQVIVWLFAGLWLIQQIRSHENRFKLSQTNRTAWLFIATLAASAITSLVPTLTVFKVYQIVVEFLFCSYFIAEYGMESFLQRLLFGNLALSLCVAAFAVVAPDLVYEFSETGALRLRGTAITEAGLVAAFALILLLITSHKIPKLWFVLLLLLMTFLLLATLTRVAWFAVGIVVLLAVAFRPKLARIRWVYALGALAITALLFGALQDLQNYRKTQDIYTLSDRLGLWQYMTDAVATESPWMGLGYLAGPRTLGLEYNTMLGSGHSIFMDVYVGGGAISLAMFLVLILSLSRRAATLISPHCNSLEFAVFAMFIVLLTMGLVGGDIDNSPFGFTFWGLVAAIPLIASNRSSESPQKLLIGAPQNLLPQQ